MADTLTDTLYEKRKILITTRLGVVLLQGTTILTDDEILEIFDKSKFGIFVKDKIKTLRLDLI